MKMLYKLQINTVSSASFRSHLHLLAPSCVEGKTVAMLRIVDLVKVSDGAFQGFSEILNVFKANSVLWYYC